MTPDQRRHADGRLAVISRRLEVAQHPVENRGETYPAHYWRRCYAEDVDTLVKVVDALAIEIRGYAAIRDDGIGNNGNGGN